MNRNNFRLGLNSLKVKYKGRNVGLLAITKDKKVAFSYDEDWLKNGFSISPFSLPLENKVFVPTNYNFEGLFGVFADSLPDAWGKLLVDRMLQENGLGNDVTVLDRLALVGVNGMGALEYEPNYEFEGSKEIYDLDYLSKECQKILLTEYSKDLDMLYRLGGSSGGARPKILTTYEGKDCVLIDTAGIRRKRSIELESVESYSVLRSMEAIRRADVVIIVFDASEDLSDQDIRIAGYVHEQGKPSVIAINKWDLVSKDDKTINFYKQRLNSELKFMDYYLPVFISAKTGQRLNTIMPAVIKAYQNSTKKTSTSILNEILQDAVAISQPPSKYGKRLKFYFISQTGVTPPTFTIQANDSTLVHFSYQRYLENALRRNIDLSGTPIKIEFKDKKGE